MEKVIIELSMEECDAVAGGSGYLVISGAAEQPSEADDGSSIMGSGN